MMRRMWLVVTFGLLTLTPVAGETRPGDPAGQTEEASPAEPAADPAPVLLDGVDAPSAETAQRLAPYFAARNTLVRDWTADGKSLYVTTPLPVVAQVHRVDMAMGALHQITFFSDPVGRVRASRGAGAPFLVFSPDLSGQEGNQVLRLDLGSRNVTAITDGEGVNTSFELSRNGQLLAYTAMVSGSSAVLALDPRDPVKTRTLCTLPGRVHVEDISPDAKRLLVAQVGGAGEGAMVQEIDLETGKATPITNAQTDAKVSFAMPRYAADGKAFFATSDGHGEHRQLVRVELPDGSETPVTTGPHADVLALDVAPAGGAVAFVSVSEGISTLNLLDPKTSAVRKVNGLPEGTLSSPRFDPTGARLAVDVSSARVATDVFVVDVATGEAVRWTRSAVGGLDPDGWTQPTLEHFPTFDATKDGPRQLPVLYFRPQPRKPGGKLPVLVMLPDGPRSRWKPSFNGMVASFTEELGMAVLQPTLRGADGMGKSFLALDDGARREDVYRDLGALLDWIKTRPELDADRVGLIGAFYGGFLTASAMGRFPDRVRTGVSMSGIVSLADYISRSDPELQKLYRAEYGDESTEEGKKLLAALAPEATASKIRSPVLFVHGARDQLAPLTTVQHLFHQLRDQKAAPAVMVEQNEGHGLSAERAQLLAAVTIFSFLRKHLAGQ